MKHANSWVRLITVTLIGLMLASFGCVFLPHQGGYQESLLSESSSWAGIFFALLVYQSSWGETGAKNWFLHRLTAFPGHGQRASS
jgi:hypothetical protein